jgi:hypothetical protein
MVLFAGIIGAPMQNWSGAGIVGAATSTVSSSAVAALAETAT